MLLVDGLDLPLPLGDQDLTCFLGDLNEDNLDDITELGNFPFPILPTVPPMAFVNCC